MPPHFLMHNLLLASLSPAPSPKILWVRIRALSPTAPGNPDSVMCCRQQTKVTLPLLQYFCLSTCCLGTDCTMTRVLFLQKFGKTVTKAPSSCVQRPPDQPNG